MLLYLPDIPSNPSLFSSGSCVSNLCIDLGRAELLSCVVSGMPGFFIGLPHGFPAYPWFLIGRPGCFVRDAFRCTTENSLLKRIPCVINCCRRCALCHEVIVKLNHVFMVCVYCSLPSLPCCIAAFCALVVCVERHEIQTLHEWLRGLRCPVLQ